MAGEIEVPRRKTHMDDVKIKIWEGENFKIFRTISEEPKEEKSVRYKGIPDMEFSEDKIRIIVSLSWRRNIKSVINWMRKHMEAYPETRYGFLVDFIDYEGNLWYEVMPCAGYEKGEKIKWINYKILPYKFEWRDAPDLSQWVRDEIIDALKGE